MFPPAALIAQASPSPAPTATPRFELHVNGSNVFIDQATSGAGAVPPEGGAFIGGAPAAPMTPYDWFTAMPLVPGVSGSLQYLMTGTLHHPGFTLDASMLLSGIVGDPTNATYWSEPLLGPFDPLEGRSNLSVPIAYPTHAGNNDVLAGALVLPYSVDIHANDDRWKLAAGFVQASNYDSFVFVQPPYSTYVPSMNVQTFESLGPGLSDLQSWSHLAPALPMLGADATAKIGVLNVEATDAILPGPTASMARMTGGSIVYDRGEAGRYSADLIHVLTGGAPVVVPSLFGSNPSINPGAQGPLALSTLGGQAQTIAGARAFFHPGSGYDATVELGRAWYNASLVARPGTNGIGNFQHYALTRRFNATDNAGLEYYRMDPRYASTLLPYGSALNLWGIAWAYPGPWLKGAFQLVNNAWGGSNREGWRAHATIVRGPWTAGAAGYAYQQVEPSTLDNLTRTGFVEVDYLVLAPGDLQIGHTRGVQGYLAWSRASDKLSLDYANDTQSRGFASFAPVDGVAMHYPQLVLAEQHKFSPGLTAAAGYGRYLAVGSWTTTPVHDAYAFGFAGIEADFGRLGQLFVQLRSYGVRGFPSIPGGPPPTLRGTGVVVDHHFAF